MKLKLSKYCALLDMQISLTHTHTLTLSHPHSLSRVRSFSLGFGGNLGLILTGSSLTRALLNIWMYWTLFSRSELRTGMSSVVHLSSRRYLLTCA